MDSKKAKITLKDIAQAAGVSVAAVSKALHDKPDIGLKTTANVRRIVQEMGYHPNNIAKSLRTGKTNIIGVIIPDNCNPYNALVLKSVEEALQKRDYTAILGNSNENPETERKLLHSMISAKVDGVLAIPSMLQNFVDIELPVVFMSRSPYLAPVSPEVKRKVYSYVVNDDVYGEYLAASHLIDRGYRNIFLLAGNNEPDTLEGGMNRARAEGYRQALVDAGIPFDPSKVLYGVVKTDQSYAAAISVLANCTLPVAFCVTSDYSALGVISALNNSGLRIPAEAALVGYDDIDVASYSTPQLTTISQAKSLIGSRSAEQLLGMIEGIEEYQTLQQTMLKPILVIRATT